MTQHLGKSLQDVSKLIYYQIVVRHPAMHDMKGNLGALALIY